MQITYLGHSSFKIKGKKRTVVTDPFDKSVGFAMPSVKADIVTVSHSHKDHSNTKAVKGDPFIVKAPGEYEIGGVTVIGLRTFHDNQKGKKRGKNTVYVITIDGFSLCHLGDLGCSLKEKQLDEINGIDVLFIPVGGVFTIGPKKAQEIINQIEPKLVVPMHYKTAKHSQAFSETASLKKFLKEIDQTEVKTKKKLKISHSSLPEEDEHKITPLKAK